jgi:His/Glu/Gln/Arg/opine family amino acid ABC transporter permease subunit
VAVQVDRPPNRQRRVPLYRNVTFLKWAAQVLALLAVIGLGVLLWTTASANLEDRGIDVSFEFLDEPPGIAIREGIDTRPQTGAAALYTGIVNMLRVTVAGIFAATILGILIGIARLSSNWIVNKVATAYIETIRNIPLLVQIIFWAAIITIVPADVAFDTRIAVSLPIAALIVGLGVIGAAVGAALLANRARRRVAIAVLAAGGAAGLIGGALWLFGDPGSVTPINTGCANPGPGCEGWLFLSNKGASIAWLFPSTGFWQWMVFLIGGVFAAIYVYRRRFRLKEQRGDETYALSWAFGTFVLVALIGWFAHPLVGFLGALWGIIADGFDALPTFAMQTILALGALAAAAWWIKRFLDARRTPAGLAKLTDDDIFRLGSAAVVGIVGAIAFLQFSGISDFLLDAGRDLFEVADDKFEFGQTGEPLRLGRPSIVQPGNFPNYGRSGLTMTTAFFAVFVGVTIYTAAFIAEVVRGGILAITKGQTEAGLALGLRRSQLLRFIVLPQAFRIILPPMGNQYLNLAKNTSLGIAVAYPEVVAVGQTLYNQTGATIPVVALWMLFYVSVSLLISSVVNWYNRRIQLVER